MMKTASRVLSLAVLLISGVCCQRLLQNIPEVGLGPMVKVGSDTSGRFSGPDSDDGGSTMEEDLVVALEKDEQVTVVAPVELGQVLCESLGRAEDADALSFLVLNEERVIAEKTAYLFTGGDIFSDHVGRHVWTGVVIDPDEADDEAVPRTVSMSWGEVCSVETFLMKVTKRNTDGTTSLIKTVPCDTFETYTCLVEVLLEFEESAEAIMPDDAVMGGSTTSSASATASGDASGTATTTPSGRRLTDDTVIDIMMLYSDEARTLLGGISPEQMETTIAESLVRTNAAFLNSELALSVNVVYIGELPYEEDTEDSAVSLPKLRLDEAVNDLRDMFGADLVQMISGRMTFCGRGYLFFDERYGYSVAKATCLDNYSHTHEFGHNLGCYHNRESSSTLTEYAHGVRYCSAPSYRTIMGYSCASYTLRINYFSNPDITVQGRVTGTVTENNARAIQDNMVAVSNFRVLATPTPAPSTAVTPAPSVLETPTPVALPTPAPTASVTPAPTVAATPAPVVLPTPVPTTLATPAPVTPPTPAPSVLVTPNPVAFPSPAPTVLVTPTPLVAPTPSPIVPPTPVPTTLATPAPLTPPTPAPSVLVTPTPVSFPSPAPTVLFTPTPLALPTPTPLFVASSGPVFVATPAPVAPDTPAPSDVSTVAPVSPPSIAPLALPTPTPTGLATPAPVTLPTPSPSEMTTQTPVDVPTPAPSSVATPAPSRVNTPAPVGSPTPGPVTPTVPPTRATVTTVAPISTPPAYSDIGCYGDSAGDRVLSGDFVKNDGDMTTENCASRCEGSAYFGTEYSNECFCGPSTDNPTRLGRRTTCNFDCAGDATQTCGGRNAISLYRYDLYEPEYNFVGCFKDSASNRVMTGASDKNDPTMSTEVCANFCEGSPYFGTEFSKECFCASTYDVPARLGGATCNYECAGNSDETCGGFNAISVYQYPDTVVPPSAAYLGCWGDSKGGRIMARVGTSTYMTNNLCEGLCRFHPFFGTQFGVECWCGGPAIDHTTYGPSDDCNIACPGDVSQTCGGYNAMSVWEKREL